MKTSLKASLAASVFMLATGSFAQAQDATAILKSMSDYVSAQPSFTFTFDTSIEVVTPEMEKIQFDSTGDVAVSRPDKVRARRMGGYADVELLSDGKSVTLVGKHMNAYAQIDRGGSIEEVVEHMRGNTSAELPAADLLSTNPAEILMDGVIEAKHIGRGVINGVECEHLAFRTIEIDWQIWVQAGDKPIPCKYVITSKTVGAAPQYTMVIKDWKSDPQLAADAFTFTPPAGAKKIEISEMQNIDDVPHSKPMGEQQ
ncbi:hypothetical protein FHS85_004194 [Rhodoligotrophos appendicifer]|uniref:DUF2092 domain-containing protein n=1 Tax=Rhodoligotrophos appendicifer TaxID=987056 RepID=UPI001FE6C2DB|nr:DUF2092 domain-containing protein [Rhodoligotrophos appendicifer]